MKITGDLKPISGFEFTYTVNFGLSLSKETTFHLSTIPQAYFKLPSGKWATFRDVTCAAKATSFTFTLMWCKEQSAATLIVSDKSGYLGSATLTVNVSCEKCTLALNLSEVKLGNEVTCNGTLSRNFITGYEVTSEWSLSNDLLKKEGNPNFQKEKFISQDFKALKLGKTKIATTVLVLDYAKGFYFEFNKGKLEVEIKSPYNVTTDYAAYFANKNTVLNYRLNGFTHDPSIQESVTWWCSAFGVLTSEQGKESATFKTISEGGFFVVAAIVTVYGQELRVEANKKIWVGVPSLNEQIEKEHTINAGDKLKLTLAEFAHYTGNIEYSIEAGLQDRFTIERLAADEFEIKSTHPKISTDTIQIEFIASNMCGSVSNIHTIQIEAAAGVGFDKPIELLFSKEHSFYHYRFYNYEEYGGDLQSFKLYFTFSLEHKADLNVLSAQFDSSFQAFEIYDEEENLRYTCPPSTEADFQIKEMRFGKYYWVVDVQKNSPENSLRISVEGNIRGGYPRDPYIVDVAENEFEFNDIRDTTHGYSQDFRYIDERGEEIRSSGGNNIYYVMTIEQPIQLLIHTAGSKVSTEMHIMQGDPLDWKMLYHDMGIINTFDEIKNDLDLPQCVKDTIWMGQTCVKKIFSPGEYKIIFNGIKRTNSGAYNGLIDVNILGRKIKGASFEDAYELGHYQEREFKIAQFYHDIISHWKHGITPLFFHFTFDRNANLLVRAKSASLYKSVDLYNAKKEKIASSVLEECRLLDVLGGEFYISIPTQGILNDLLELELEGESRGRVPTNDCYNIGSYDTNFTFTDSMDTSDGSYYEDFICRDENGGYQNISPNTKHIYYKIRLLSPMRLWIDTEGSSVFAELYIMIGEPYDWRIFHYAEALGPFGERPLADILLLPGEYRFVFNGVKLSNGSERNGLIKVNMKGLIADI